MGILRRLAASAMVGAQGHIERSVPYLSEGKLRKLQQRRLHSILSYAYSTVPFYRDSMNRLGLTPKDFHSVEDLARLPLIDGEMLRNDLDAFVSSAYEGKWVERLHTSGTSANGRREVLWEGRTLLRTLAHGERDRATLYQLLGKASRLTRVSLYPAGGAARVVSDYCARHVYVPPARLRTHFIAPDLPYEEIADRISRLRADVVYSFGSFAEHFIRTVLDRDIPFRAPKVWVYGADVMSDAGRALIEEAFDCAVLSIYQTIEAGRVGFFCEERQGFHLNVDFCPVRLVGPDGRPVEPGEPGEIVISNLLNRVTVVLNYRSGDRGVLAAASCPCGRTLPLLETLEGRTWEVLPLSDGREIHESVLTLADREAFGKVLQYQFIIEAPGRFRWRIQPQMAVNTGKLEHDLRHAASPFLGEADTLTFEFVDSLPVSRSGKLSRVIRSGGGKENESPSVGATPE